MLIDDDSIYVEQLRLRLADWENLELMAFTSIASIAEHEAMQPDIVLVDHFLGEEKGSRYLNKFRADYPNALLCLLSAQNEVEVFADAVRNGVDLYLKKDRKILEQIRKLVTRIRPESTTEQKRVKKSRFSLKPEKTKQTPFVAPEVNEELTFIIEDDSLFAKLVQHRIQKMAKMETHLFLDADDAVLSLNKCPKLVILDYELGYMNGVQVFESIKKITPNTEVVMVTGQRNLNTAIELHNMGIKNYVVKNDLWEENLVEILESILIPKTT